MIIADEREEVVPQLLSRLGVEVKIERLECGDYLLPSFIIERKRVGDLLNSIKSGRIFSQLSRCAEFASSNNLAPLLLIEGPIREIEKRGMVNAVSGFLLILQFSGFKVLFSPSPLATASILKSLLSFKRKDLREKPRVVRGDLPQLSVLCSFPGIGPKRGKKLLSHFRSLSRIFAASEEELRKVIPRSVARKMREILKEEKR